MQLLSKRKMVAICFYMLPFEEKKEKKKERSKKQTTKKIPYATAFSYCFITNLQRSCITLFYTN